jgi:hypothetical protein
VAASGRVQPTAPLHVSCHPPSSRSSSENCNGAQILGSRWREFTKGTVRARGRTVRARLPPVYFVNTWPAPPPSPRGAANVYSAQNQPSARSSITAMSASLLPSKPFFTTIDPAGRPGPPRRARAPWPRGRVDVDGLRVGRVAQPALFVTRRDPSSPTVLPVIPSPSCLTHFAASRSPSADIRIEVTFAARVRPSADVSGMRSTRVECSPAIAPERAIMGLRNPGCSLQRMSSSTNTAIPLSTTPTPSQSLAELSDAELLVATRTLVGRSNQLLAALLAHLGEVEARGIHRTRACPSLYAYCIYELRFSEDEAFRRVAAARLVRRFPALWDAVASGELHLTGLLMLGPHLTGENLSEVLLRTRHRTKKEIARLVRQLDPLPDVPARIEPLGPAPARVASSAPTWDEFVSSLRPVRELLPGERPRDWTANANDVEADPTPQADSQAHAQPARASLPDLLSPERYRVQFTAGEEYVKLVEEARALLSHSSPRATLDDIQLRAMRALVAALKRQKYAVTPRPQKPSRAVESPAKPVDPQSSTAVLEGEKTRGAEVAQKFATERETDAVAERESESEPESARKSEPQRPRRRGRHIPASVRRAVLERDEARCTYSDDSGRRCAETHGLEFHHLIPFAQGGEHTEANLTLLCRSHNALAAEEDFGRELIELARSASDHEPWAAQPGS